LKPDVLAGDDDGVAVDDRSRPATSANDGRAARVESKKVAMAMWRTSVSIVLSYATRAGGATSLGVCRPRRWFVDTVWT
jgi:hypothetical protein